jgi:16S rRNA (uracil1498-N3)-methyltransferase
MAGENYFYFPELKEDMREAILTGDEHLHLSKSLRLRSGQPVMLVNGKGLAAQARINRIISRETHLELFGFYNDYNELKTKIFLGIGQIKQGHLELLVEKAVELGVAEIHLLQTRYVSHRKLNLQRLEKIAIVAMKQCGRSRIPPVFSPVSLTNFLDLTEKLPNRFIFDNQEQTPHYSQLLPPKNAAETVLLIGPEGGFSQEEIALSRNKSIQAVQLGQRRLRSETAAIMALALTAANSKEETL